MRTLPITVVAIMAILSAGCGTSYSPREPGRIHIVLNPEGKEFLERDGQRYSMGGFSGGQVLAAVAGNPAAEDRARAYVDNREAFSGYAIASGVALCVMSFLLIALTAEPTQDSSETPSASRGNTLPIAFGLSALLGIASFVGAAINHEESQQNLYDAINLYNAGLSKQSP